MSRSNIVLIILLVVQIVVGGILLATQSAASVERVSQVLLPGLDAEEVVTLSITDGQGNRVVLERREEGWVLPEFEDYPVVAGVPDDIIRRIAQLRSDRLIAQTSASFNRLRVAPQDYERLVELGQPDGLDRLYIGTSAGATASHMRANDDEAVYLTSGLAAWEVGTTITNWINPVYFSVPVTGIVRVKVENENGIVELERAEDDNWVLVGLDDPAQFDDTRLSGLLSELSTVRVAQPLGRTAKPEYALDEPLATVTLLIRETPASALNETGEEATAEPEIVERSVVLVLGAPLETGNYPVTSSESELLVAIQPAPAQALVSLTADLFIQPLPEVTPEPEGLDVDTEEPAVDSSEQEPEAVGESEAEENESEAPNAEETAIPEAEATDEAQS